MTQHIVLENWQAVRTAMRQGVERWRARPPLQSEDDAKQLVQLLAELIDDELAIQANIFISQHNTNANRANRKLVEWNSKRIERMDKPSPQAIAAMSESGETFDVFEWRTDENGNRFPVYRLRPSREDLTGGKKR